MVNERAFLAKELSDPKRVEERLARIVEIEDNIYQRAAGVLEATLSFHEVAPNQQEPSPEWVEQYGAEGAKQKLAVAKTGWLPQALAPNATKLALQYVTAVTRARRGAVVKANELNVQIQLPAPTSAAHPTVSVYPRREIE